MGDYESIEADARREDAEPDWLADQTAVPDEHHVMLDIQWSGNPALAVQQIEHLIDGLYMWIEDQPDTYDLFIAGQSDTGWSQEWAKPTEGEEEA